MPDLFDQIEARPVYNAGGPEDGIAPIPPAVAPDVFDQIEAAPLPQRGLAGSLASGFSGQLAQTGAGIRDFLNIGRGRREMSQLMGLGDPGPNPETPEEVQRRLQAEAARFAPPTFGEKIAGGVGGSLPLTAGLAVTRGRAGGSIVPGIGALAVPAEATAGSLVQNLADPNQTPSEAFANAAIEGIATRLGGAFEPGFAAPIKQLPTQSAKEAVEGGATGAAQDVVSQTLGYQTTPYDPMQTLEAAGLGAATGPIMVGALGAPGAVSQALQKPPVAPQGDLFDAIEQAPPPVTPMGLPDPAALEAQWADIPENAPLAQSIEPAPAGMLSPQEEADLRLPEPQPAAPDPARLAAEALLPVSGQMVPDPYAPVTQESALLETRDTESVTQTEELPFVEPQLAPGQPPLPAAANITPIAAQPLVDPSAETQVITPATPGFGRVRYGSEKGIPTFQVEHPSLQDLPTRSVSQPSEIAESPTAVDLRNLATQADITPVADTSFLPADAQAVLAALPPEIRDHPDMVEMIEARRTANDAAGDKGNIQQAAIMIKGAMDRAARKAAMTAKTAPVPPETVTPAPSAPEIVTPESVTPSVDPSAETAQIQPVVPPEPPIEPAKAPTKAQRAKLQAPGFRENLQPEYAIPSKDPVLRDLIVQARAETPYEPIRRKQDDVERAAREEFDADPEGVRARVLGKIADPNGVWSDTEEAQATMYLEQLHRTAPDEVLKFSEAMQHMGARNAQSLAMRQDRLYKSPAARWAAGFGMAHAARTSIGHPLQTALQEIENLKAKLRRIQTEKAAKAGPSILKSEEPVKVTRKERDAKLDLERDRILKRLKAALGGKGGMSALGGEPAQLFYEYLENRIKAGVFKFSDMVADIFKTIPGAKDDKDFHESLEQDWERLRGQDTRLDAAQSIARILGEKKAAGQAARLERAEGKLQEALEGKPLPRKADPEFTLEEADIENQIAVLQSQAERLRAKRPPKDKIQRVPDEEEQAIEDKIQVLRTKAREQVRLAAAKKAMEEAKAGVLPSARSLDVPTAIEAQIKDLQKEAARIRALNRKAGDPEIAKIQKRLVKAKQDLAEAKAGKLPPGPVQKAAHPLEEEIAALREQTAEERAIHRKLAKLQEQVATLREAHKKDTAKTIEYLKGRGFDINDPNADWIQNPQGLQDFEMALDASRVGDTEAVLRGAFIGMLHGTPSVAVTGSLDTSMHFVDAVKRHVEWALRAIAGKPFAGEAGAYYSAIFPSVAQGVRNFFTTVYNEKSALPYGDPGEYHIHPSPLTQRMGVTGTILRQLSLLPTARAIDAGNKTIAANLDVVTWAHRTAVDEAGNQLKGDALKAHLAKEMEQGSDSWLHAIEHAKRMTFTQEAIQPVKMLIDLKRHRNAVIRGIATMQFPFVMTATNAFRRLTRDYTPVVSEIALIAKYAFEDKDGSTALKRHISREIAQATTRWLMLVVAGMIVDQEDEEGNKLITGYAPEKKAFGGVNRFTQAPHAIRIGSGKDAHYIDLGRLSLAGRGLGLLTDTWHGKPFAGIWEMFKNEPVPAPFFELYREMENGAPLPDALAKIAAEETPIPSVLGSLGRARDVVMRDPYAEGKKQKLPLNPDGTPREPVPFLENYWRHYSGRADPTVHPAKHLRGPLGPVIDKDKFDNLPDWAMVLYRMAGAAQLMPKPEFYQAQKGAPKKPIPVAP